MGASQFWAELYGHVQRSPLSSIDAWFVALRLLAFLGGLMWLMVAAIPAPSGFLLSCNFVFFFSYSAVLCAATLWRPEQVRRLYLAALFLDLFFLHWLIRYTGGFESEFFLAFFLLIALHAFYFGLRVGAAVGLLSSCVYVLAGQFDISALSPLQLVLRLTFFLLVATSMGLVSHKQQHDRKKIESLNKELDRRRIEVESEKEKLESVILGIGAGLVLVNRDMRIEWMNKVAEGWFGPLSTQKGRLCVSVLWGSGTLCSNCPTQKCFQFGVIEQADLEHRTAKGQRKHFRFTAAPIRNEAGETVSVLELIQDITEEKTLQAQLLQSSKLAAIGELAGGIAHEINNPLGAIVVCVEELAELLGDVNSSAWENNDDVLECIHSIKNDIYRCKRITTGFLNFSRSKKIQFESTDINQLLMNTALLTRYKAQKEHAEIDFYLQSGLPMILAESDELAQVFLNILINAIDFTTPGESIDVRTEALPNSEIAIRIVDRGCGIPQHNMPSIFSPFFTTKPPGQGTGLGLAVSRRIVERHHGRIEVLSKEDSGTTITIVLPIDPKQVETIATRNSMAELS